ncbi:MAG TPA: tetratricopeptide repeat protein [Ktedonobacteraceae bacterium]|nr:tetratricopeptide repeat protein [Ktedonobacteraceae bacterium]
MGETLNLLFRSRDDGTFELQVKESWSGHTVRGSFVPPYTNKQLNILQKKLNNLDSGYQELREIGHRLFLALCGSETPGASRREASEQSVQAVLRSVIQRTLKRRGTVALTLCFGPGCDEFVRYPWELLHNGDHFLLVSGIFTLTRALLRPDMPTGCELPVSPPLRVLYIGASPVDCAPLETEQSFAQLERALSPLIDSGQVFLDRLEPPTFDQLVRYLSSYGGAGVFDDSDTSIPCYVVHFDGHGAYGRLCPAEGCEALNEAEARKCVACGRSLSRVRPQTYLCFCNDEGYNRFIDTQSLCDLFLSSDVRLAVFAACETATIAGGYARQQRRRNAVDATLATALVMAQVPAVVAMPFSLQDDLSPTFMYHFYEALADGRTLEEGLSRARQALLPMQQRGWFVPVLYRHVVEGQEGPVPLLVSHDAPEEHDHPLAHLGAPATYVGREQELRDLEELLTAAATGEQPEEITGRLKLRPGTHHIALTGPTGIGKSALAFETARRNQEKFPGGVIGVSLRDGKSFGEALIEIMHYLRMPAKAAPAADRGQRARLVLGVFRSLANRELPSLLLLDSFEEVKERAELETWLHFLCSLPQEVVVLITSRSNPETMMVLEGLHCRWYEYRVGKMMDADLLSLFTELASANGLDQRIHLDEPRQQAILREICTLLDGYPLGAELIFGTARSIDGKVYTPEAATRSLEEVRDELRSTPLAGILAALEVSYRRLTPPARLLLSYLAAFKLPFSREQIAMLVAPDMLATAEESVRLVRADDIREGEPRGQGEAPQEEVVSPAVLAENWRAARDELVQASFIQFDGRVYTIHPQVRHFAISHLPIEERRRVHRVVANYYSSLPQPSPDEWFVAFDHLESAGEPQDIQEAVRVAVRASWALGGRGHAQELLAMLRRAGVHASRLGDKTGEGQIQCCLGAILRQLGQYPEAEACLRSSLEFHRQQHESEEAGWALYELAMLFREEGNFQQAGTYAQEALALFREVGDVKGEAWMQMVMGEVSRGYASYYDALGHFELALTSFRNLHNNEGCAWTLRDRGTVYEALGQYSKALSDYEEALRLFNEAGLRVGQAWVLADKADVYTGQGKLDAAAKLCSEAVSIFHEQGIRRGEAWALRALGDVARERHDLARARQNYEDALAMFSALGDRVDQARVLNALGAVAFAEEEYLTAKELYEQAQTIAREQGAAQLDGRASRGLGDVARVLQRLAEAERYYRDAAAIATQLDTPAELCAVLRRQGLLYQVQKKYAEALDCWVQALALDQRLGHPARVNLQEKVAALVAEQHLEDVYAQFCERHGVA